MLEIFFLLLWVLIGSALCSGSEAALASISIIKVKQLVEEKKYGAMALLHIKKNISRASNAIVVLNNVINIVGSVLITASVIKLWGNAWVGICSGLLTFLIVIFAEIIPKSFGYTYPQAISLAIARPLHTIIRLLHPVLWLFNVITTIISRHNTEKVGEKDVLSLIDLAYQDRKIKADEHIIAKRVFQLNDKTVGEIKTPRTVMTYLNCDDILSKSAAKIIASPHSRIPILGETIDDVVGVALKDALLIALIKGDGERPVTEFLQPVIRTLESKKIDELLREFLENKQQLAVIFDEYGGLEGVVTLEDILEELMGREIIDETDRAGDLQKLAKKQAQKKFQESAPHILEDQTDNKSQT